MGAGGLSPPPSPLTLTTARNCSICFNSVPLSVYTTAAKNQPSSLWTVSELAWSEWSECSATCGTGVQVRVLYCRLANVRRTRRRQFQLNSLDGATGCSPGTTGLTETKQCTSVEAKVCPGSSRN